MLYKCKCLFVQEFFTSRVTFFIFGVLRQCATNSTKCTLLVVHASMYEHQRGKGRTFFAFKERERRRESRHTAQAPAGDRRFAFVGFLRPCTKKRESLNPRVVDRCGC